MSKEIITVRPFAPLLRAQMDRAQVSRHELSALTGDSISAITKWRLGHRIPNRDAVCRIVQALGCKAEDLM